MVGVFEVCFIMAPCGNHIATGDMVRRGMKGLSVRFNRV
ncbi:hypothetical protein YPPY66_5260 [Yersinia pestis PY-66]|uniref:Uncharacterized protein n=1 Tax=Yersinia pestis PY-08 TaxID=992134 RepID=A0AB72ZQR4_YERPE|nr:hypothetical protein YPPY01_4720 [Yersinia pestis PY-01]EIQ97077.1 hypothetical protein YPPY05_4855 [Yersinia pestis PY-05]EIQ99910.1 hypothetical protein YPPY03_4915 [Yersinia pestis PY-03]EIR10395.1 hypothetical protein YPPY04_4825 [Yersinia pestis PY-04]EIR13236.1 hypothetical protein YPPY09_4819 [Yersinia pestis PY-09]EIR24598.1 hypothetical protein YPPY07_4758 [Yersinia pestis PY-07]EIR25665.1 hypothetical protein YPPY10_4823 [Yersinia pestis PY-10]EIR26247.1 hypothetical protein YPP